MSGRDSGSQSFDETCMGIVHVIRRLYTYVSENSDDRLWETDPVRSVRRL